jgi:hypothetical protein
MAGRLGTIAPTVRSDPPAWLRRAPFWIWGLVLMLICPPLTVVVAGVAGFKAARALVNLAGLSRGRQRDREWEGRR